MKNLLNRLLIFCVLAVLGWALVRGFTHKTEGKDDEPKAAEGEVKEEKPEDFTVTLEKAKWKALGLEMAEPEKTELKPQRTAFGSVLDPTPIIALDAEMNTAEAAWNASKADYDRTQVLLRSGENTSRKVAETAEAQYRADDIKLLGLRRKAAMDWGAEFAALTPAKRAAFVEQLVRGDAALLRADVLPGEALAEVPAAARVQVLGRETQPFSTTSITPASDTDPKTQAQSFVLRVDKPPFKLRPGMALTAWLEMPEKATAGFAIPQSAVLRHDGRTWVYVQEEEEKFARKAVTLGTPLGGDKGWFIAEDGGLKADELIVVTGPQTLLSEELKAQGGGAPD